jgi:hypothetical protein
LQRSRLESLEDEKSMMNPLLFELVAKVRIRERLDEARRENMADEAAAISRDRRACNESGVAQQLAARSSLALPLRIFDASAVEDG